MSTTDIYIKNRPITFEYAIEDKLKAGIVLTGSEIKSVRNSKVSFNDSYCFFSQGELWIKSLHIAEYVNADFAAVRNAQGNNTAITGIDASSSEISDRGCVGGAVRDDWSTLNRDVGNKEQIYDLSEMPDTTRKKLFQLSENVGYRRGK